jgi:N-acetylmuramoyl-L-alanine amidase
VALLAAGALSGALGVRAGHALDLPVASDVRLGGDEQQTRFVVDLSRKIDLRAFTLADPYRVVVDVPQVIFKLPAKTGATGRGLVTAFRYGLVMQGGSRIVLDVKRPVRIEKAFTLEAADGQPARLVLDLAAVDADTFRRNMALESRAPTRSPVPRRDFPDQSADPRPVVVIDPGHGGIDLGTTAAGGETEKQIVLEFSMTLRDVLEKSGKYRVVLTRTDDTFVALADRVRIARAERASLFVSVHADSLQRGAAEVQGASVYTLSETASDAEAARLAEAENKADVIAGVDLTGNPNDVTDILIDLAQRETKSFSNQFARLLVKELKVAGRLHRNPLKSAGFRVLTAPDVPSVLVELGYVSNRQDLKLLMSEAWRTRAANSIAQAVETYFTTRLAGARSSAGPN